MFTVEDDDRKKKTSSTNSLPPEYQAAISYRTRLTISPQHSYLLLHHNFITIPNKSSENHVDMPRVNSAQEDQKRNSHLHQWQASLACQNKMLDNGRRMHTKLKWCLSVFAEGDAKRNTWPLLSCKVAEDLRVACWCPLSIGRECGLKPGSILEGMSL